MTRSGFPEEKIKARLKVRFKDLAAFISEYRHNISKGGIFIRSQSPMPVGTRVEVVLILPEVEATVMVRGPVLFVVEPAAATDAQPSGMGIDLKAMEPGDKAMIEEYIRIQKGEAGDDLERREHKRWDGRIRVRFGSLDALVDEYLHNISHGGIYIRTNKPRPLRDKVKIILAHPVNNQEMILDGEVVRVVEEADARKTGQPAGMGIRFTTLDDYMRQQLDAFINSDAVHRNKCVEIDEN